MISNLVNEIMMTVSKQTKDDYEQTNYDLHHAGRSDVVWTRVLIKNLKI
jgi:hypothetical protein